MHKSAILSYCCSRGMFLQIELNSNNTLTEGSLLYSCLQQRREQFAPVIEQLGSFDSFANEHNEKLVALDYERIRHWLGKGAIASKPVAELLGKSKFFGSIEGLFKTSAVKNRCRIQIIICVIEVNLFGREREKSLSV